MYWVLPCFVRPRFILGRRAPVPSTRRLDKGTRPDHQQRTKTARNWRRGKKQNEKKTNASWPVRVVRACQPMTAHVAKASHQRGPTPGLIQPVTGVKRLLAPRSLKSHLRIFPRPLREPCLLPLHDQSIPPCPVRRTSSNCEVQDGEKKGPSRASRVQSDSSVKGAQRNIQPWPFTASRLSRSDPLASRAQRPSTERLGRSVKP
ncbi:hypothetical protein HDV63DRAFT_192665 [Trichoderma sp. SZMC 28014]